MSVNDVNHIQNKTLNISFVHLVMEENMKFFPLSGTLNIS